MHVFALDFIEQMWFLEHKLNWDIFWIFISFCLCVCEFLLEFEVLAAVEAIKISIKARRVNQHVYEFLGIFFGCCIRYIIDKNNIKQQSIHKSWQILLGVVHTWRLQKSWIFRPHPSFVTRFCMRLSPRLRPPYLHKSWTSFMNDPTFFQSTIISRIFQSINRTRSIFPSSKNNPQIALFLLQTENAVNRVEQWWSTHVLRYTSVS